MIDFVRSCQKFNFNLLINYFFNQNNVILISKKIKLTRVTMLKFNNLSKIHDSNLEPGQPINFPVSFKNLAKLLQVCQISKPNSVKI
jgi:hypothetical protein